MNSTGDVRMMRRVVLLCVYLTFFLVGNCYQVIEKAFFDQSFNNFSFPKEDRTFQPVTRIIGGVEPSSTSHPFQAAIYVYMQRKSYFCGGTLIYSDWVLTAAHCLSDQPLYAIVVLGAHNLTSTEATRIELNSSSFIVHKNWNPSTFQNDIALVRLPKNVSLNDYITTIEFSTEDETYEDEVGIILGWGLTECNAISAVLQQVDAVVIGNDECAATDTDYHKVIVASHLCTSGIGFIGSCGGDSGGPLVVNGVQIGIVSFGSSDCISGKPSVFTRINYFSDWIEKYTTSTSSCYKYGHNTQHIVLTYLIIYLLQQFVTIMFN